MSHHIYTLISMLVTKYAPLTINWQLNVSAVLLDSYFCFLAYESTG